MDEKTQVAVVGGTGVVGKEILAALAEQGHPADKLTVLGTQLSEGQELEYGDETLEVELASGDAFRGMGVVFLAVPADAAKTLAPAAQAAGAWVVDVSPAFRLQPSVPLVLPPALGLPLKGKIQGRIVSVASPVSAVAAALLEALGASGGVSELSLSVLLGASSRGMAGVRELERQTADLLTGREPEPAAFPHRIAFNLVPEVGAVAENGWTDAETSLVAELARAWQGKGDLPAVAATAIWVPTFYAAYVSGTLRLKSGRTLDTVRERLKANAALKVLDAPAEHVYPLPQLVVGDSSVHVGRLRVVASSPGLVSFVAAIDNAGWTARTAVDVAERLVTGA